MKINLIPLEKFIAKERSNLTVLTAYIILTIIFTYPVAVSGDKIPGKGGDSYQYLWFLWWFKTALLNFNSPYYTTYIFHPTGVNLAFSAFTPFNSILSIPLQIAFGLITSYNILWIISFIAAGYGTYLLVRYLIGNTQAAFISGLIFMFSPYHFAHSLGHLNLTAIEWIPFYILYLFKTVNENKLINAIYAAFFLFLTALCEYYYLVYLSFFTLIFFLYYQLADKRIIRKGTIKRISMIFATFGLIFSPFAYPLIKELFLSKSSYMYTDSYNFVFYSADFLGFFIPTQFHPFFKEYVSPIYNNFTGNQAEYTVFAGYTVLFLALFAFIKIKTKEIRFWAISAIIFFIFSLGPVLHINGKLIDYIPLPYLLIMRIPVISIARVPSRWDILVMLSLAVLAGYGINYFFKRFEGKIFNGISISKKDFVALLFSGLILFEFLAIPYPMSSGKVPGFYYQLRNDIEDYAILELPYSIEFTPGYMYYQTVHEKKIVNGYASRMPDYTKEFIDNTPFINNISLYLNKQKDNTLSSDILNLNITDTGLSILNYYNIRYIILHKNYLTKSQLDFENEMIKATLKEEPEIYAEDNLIVYKIKMKKLKQFLLLRNNWYPLEGDNPHRWISNNASIFVYSTDNNNSNISFRVLRLDEPKMLHVYLNDELIFKTKTSTNFDEVEIPLKMKIGENIIRFYTPDGCQHPIDIPQLNSKDSRCLSFAFQNITLY